jgi:4-oxalocrotonate tautomerase
LRKDNTGRAQGPGIAGAAACAIVAAHAKEDRMPEVVVYALGGRSLDQKRGLMKDITEAVMKNFSVPAEAVVVTLVETEKQAKMKGGVLFSEMGQR